MGSTRRYHCSCLYEIENNLPRTKHCFTACHDQIEIIASRERKMNTPIDVIVSQTISNNPEMVKEFKNGNKSMLDLLVLAVKNQFKIVNGIYPDRNRDDMIINKLKEKLNKY